MDSVHQVWAPVAHKVFKNQQNLNNNYSTFLLIVCLSNLKPVSHEGSNESHNYNKKHCLFKRIILITLENTMRKYSNEPNANKNNEKTCVGIN